MITDRVKISLTICETALSPFNCSSSESYTKRTNSTPSAPKDVYELDILYVYVLHVHCVSCVRRFRIH